MASARTSLPGAGGANEPDGVTSVCSGHPLVLEAAMLQAGADGTTVLIEATCNQVNHQGGYTGLTPATFRQEVHRIAERAGFQRERIVLGGDHLGPSPWRHLPAEKALQEAEIMVAEYVAAGYTKIHLDCSMGCKDEPEHLGDALSAERAARLAEVAERVAAGSGTAPYYVVGTEVPTPGGALHQIETLEVTTPSAVLATLEAHRRAFAARGTTAAFDRVIAVVAQPGVEFDNQNVVVYRPELARELRTALTKMPGLVFEAHSTDYQPPESLVNLVRDGFSVLKVGPGLTFSMRQALYGLDYMAATLDPDWQQHSLMTTMEHEMLAAPGRWSAYYPGGPATQKLLRHFSYSDRIRYYWAAATAREAVQRLFARLSTTDIPLPLVSQFLPTLYERVAGGELTRDPQSTGDRGRSRRTAVLCDGVRTGDGRPSSRRLMTIGASRAALMAPPIFVGVSLKMYFGHARTLEWCRQVADLAGQHPALRQGLVDLVVLPSFPSLPEAVEILGRANIGVGAQDLCSEDFGPFTGEVGAPNSPRSGAASSRSAMPNDAPCTARQTPPSPPRSPPPCATA